jgi:hypothetical protein
MKQLYFIRHGQTNFNIQWRSDEIGEAYLTEIWLEEANVLAYKLQWIIDFWSTMIYCSPLPRAFATVKPYLLTQLSQKEIQELEDKHNKCYLLYKDLVDRDSLFDYIHNSQENQILTYKINNNINIDFRITEWFSIKYPNRSRAPGYSTTALV